MQQFPHNVFTRIFILTGNADFPFHHQFFYELSLCDIIDDFIFRFVHQADRSPIDGKGDIALTEQLGYEIFHIVFNKAIWCFHEPVFDRFERRFQVRLGIHLDVGQYVIQSQLVGLARLIQIERGLSVLGKQFAYAAFIKRRINVI